MLAPTVGHDVGLIAKVRRPEGIANVVSGSVTEDERRANDILVLGKGDAATRAAARSVGSAFHPAVQAVITMQDETSTAALQARGDAYLRSVENLAIIELELRADSLDAQLGTFNPGDVGLVTVESGADAYWPDGALLTQRIIKFDVTVPDGGDGETVKFSFDDPVGNF